MRKDNVFLAIAIGLAVAAFWLAKTENFEFIQLDDPDYVFRNEKVRSGISIDGLLWSFCNLEAGKNWHPLTWTSLMLDASISGSDIESLSRVMHGHNAILQGASAFLLFMLMLELLGQPRERRHIALSALLTLVWAIHPLRVECVCWVTERKELLCAAFSLCTILLWLRKGNRSRAAAVAAYALALLSKSVAVTVPVVLVALDILHDGDWRRTVHDKWKLWCLLFVMAGIASCFTLVAQTPAVKGNQEDVTFLVKLGNAVGAYAVHLTRGICPVRLYFYRRFINHVDWYMFVPGFIIVCTMLYATVRSFTDRARMWTYPAIGFLAAAWIGAGLLPMCGLIRVGIEMNPDRHGNWIGAGLVVILALLSAKIRHRAAWVSAFGLLGALATAYAVAAWNYAEVFRNNYLLFANTIRIDPEHPQALGQLGSEYAMRFHDRDTAIQLSERSISLEPTDEVGAQLVTLLSARGRPEDYARIKEVCHEVVADHSKDDRGGALTALGVVAMHEHKWDEAILYFKDANSRRRAKSMPIDDNRIRIAMCKMNKGDVDGASVIFKDLAQKSKDVAIKRKSREVLQMIWQRKQ